MTLKDDKTGSGNSNRSPQVRLRQPTCSDCGSKLIFRGWPGYVCRHFIKAVACEPDETQGTGDNSSAVPHDRILYERLPDGSLNVDYDEDNYDRSRYEDNEFFACAECDHVLQFENGSEVRGEEELVEWLTLNSEQSGGGQHHEGRLQCQSCGNETFFISHKDTETQLREENPSYVCAKCGCELKG